VIFPEISMISFKMFMQRLAAAASALVLFGCGGYTSVDLGGSVSGLVTNGLVLANGSDTVAIPSGATSYKFPHQIGTHDAYNVTVQSQPANYTCVVTNTPGVASGLAISYVNVVCAKTTHALSVTVNGLTGSGLVLANGSDQVTVSAGTTSPVTAFFPTAVAETDTYGVVVLTQPTNPAQTCTVQNGTGIMGTSAPTNITVTCQ
jgi:hypothetical protein